MAPIQGPPAPNATPRSIPLGQTWTSYYAVNGQPAAMRVADPVSSTVYYLHADHLGSLSLVTSVTGAVVARRSYLPYGDIRYQTGAIPTTIGFTAQRRDTGLGSLMYFRARFYSPAAARFISPDALIPQPRNPQALNRYAYVYNRPLIHIDSSGHIAFIPLLIIGGIIALKAIDYGWTAYDVYDSLNTIASPFAAIEDKIVAGVNIGLSVGLEAAEPDDLIPLSVPLDDVARMGIVAGIRRVIKEGGANAGLRFIKEQLGDGAIRALFSQGVFKGIRPYKEWNTILMGVRRGANIEVHHLIEEQHLKILKGLAGGDVPAVVLDRIVHSGPANTNSVTQLFNANATRNPITNAQTLWDHYKRVYGDLGHQDWLDAIWPLFASRGVVQ